MPARLPFPILAVLAALLTLCAAPAALAGEPAFDGSTLRYTGLDDVLAPDDLVVGRTGDDYRLTDVAMASSGDGCLVNDGTALCDDDVFLGDDWLVVNLRGGDDRARIDSPFLETALPGAPAGAGVNGQEGDDVLTGGPGRDTLRGAAGADRLDGRGGDDTLSGGGEPDRDVFAGGDGFDRLDPNEYLALAGVEVTLDDVDNDGGPSGRDDVRSDVEWVTGSPGDDRLVGSPGSNVLQGAGGGDRIDGGGGADTLAGGAGDDRIVAVDGLPDDVSCGAGVDGVGADDRDRVSADCENVSRQAGPANPLEDAPPTVTLAAPAPDTILPAEQTTRLSAEASDDAGISRVIFYDDERQLSVEERPPYGTGYVPRGADVGFNTLTVVAVDSAGQTAFEQRRMRVSKFRPRGLSVRALSRRGKRRGRLRPVTLRFSGRLALPFGLPRSIACGESEVRVELFRGRKRAHVRRARIKRDCTYSASVRFRDLRRQIGKRYGVTALFAGNRALERATGRTSVKVR